MSGGTGTPAFKGDLGIVYASGQQLGPSEMAALKQLFRCYGGQPFRLEQANAAAFGTVSGADIRAALPALLRSGVVAAVRKAWGEKLYYVPLNKLLELQLVWEYPALRVQGTERVGLLREAKPGLALDLFCAISWIADNGLRITAKGTIHQKERSKLESRIRLDERDVTGLRLNYPHPDAYSPALAVVLDLLLALGLIAKERLLWRLNASTLAAWLALDVQAMNLILLRELLVRYVPAEAGLQHVALRLAAADLQTGVWYSLEELLGSLQERGLLESGMSKERESWIMAWLEALCGCGWLELGEHPEDGVMFRWRFGREELASPEAVNAAGEEGDFPAEARGRSPFVPRKAAPPAGKFIVQPDFELLVPPDVPFTIRFELEACAEHVATDVMSVYRLSRAGVERASRLGRSPQDILALLTEHAAGVPDTVRSALEQWGREIGRTALAEALLLSCADRETADKISGLSPLNGKLERIGPLHFIVGPGYENEILKVLDSERLAPNRQWGGAKESEYPRLLELASDERITDDRRFARGSFHEGSQGWIYKGAELHFYQPDHEAPDIEELFPGHAKLPPMWWKEMRAYHSSTARQLVERALEWRTKLALQIDGETAQCLPLAIMEKEGDWRVKVRYLPPANAACSERQEAEALLSPADWQAICMILPAGLR